jgi:hypothetical protein
MRNWTLWRGQPPPEWTGHCGMLDPSKTEEKPTSSFRVIRAGCVGARAILELWPSVGKRKKKEENVWMMVRTWTNWNLIRELLGMIDLKGF